MPFEIGKIHSLDTEYREYMAALEDRDQQRRRVTWGALKDKMRAEFKAAKFKEVFFDLENIHDIHQIAIAAGHYQGKIDSEAQERTQASFDL